MASDFFGLVVGHKLGELLFQQVVLGLEAWDEAEDLLENLAKSKAAVHGGSFAKLVKGVELGGLIEHLTVHVVDDAIPLAGLHAGGDDVDSRARCPRISR